jgi:dephospho-CoA kinase
VIVGIAGKRGSGKTTLARVLARDHGFTYASFGDVVRAEAARRGLDTEVETLQRLGAALIAEWGWARFCAAVVPDSARTGLVSVEGVRHRGAVDGLRVRADGDFLLVFVELPDEARAGRLESRGSAGEPGLAADRGATEAEVDSLRAMSDLVVDGGDLVAAARIVVDRIAALRR